MSIHAFEEERSGWKFVEPGVMGYCWGIAAAGRIIENRCGEHSRMQGRSWWKGIGVGGWWKESARGG